MGNTTDLFRREFLELKNKPIDEPEWSNKR
jgi:hypothetical protein